MSTVVIEGSVRIPNYVRDFSSFCRWVASDEYPERGQISFLNGEIWVDMSPEQIFTHNLIKGEYAIVVGGLVKVTRAGKFFPDRALLRNKVAGLSTEPDGAFASWQTLKTKRLKIVRIKEGFDILLGTPDMVLEIVSESSVEKDLEQLPLLYWEAGIPEYWLVDPRGQQPRFDILQHGKSGYLPVRKHSGWVKSTVLGKAFRLSVADDQLGNPEYTLSMR